MSSLSQWIAPRRPALISIATGTATWVVAFAVAWRAWPAVTPLAAAGDRLAYAAELLVGVGVIVLLMVSSCFRVFDTPQAEDPTAGAESAAWKINQRVLSNTVEQSLIFVPAILALAVRLPPDDLCLLPVLISLWCAGRILFWVGYRIRPSLRGPGFEWTLYSSLFALLWFVHLRW
jgi:hypothetical protein